MNFRGKVLARYSEKPEIFEWVGWRKVQILVVRKMLLNQFALKHSIASKVLKKKLLIFFFSTGPPFGKADLIIHENSVVSSETPIHSRLLS